MAARESAVFQREQEYRRLERCHYAGEEDEMMQLTEETNKGGEETSSVQLLIGMRRSVQQWRGAKIRKAAPALDNSFSVLWEERPNERTATTGEAWDRTCTAQRITPQRSPFQANQAGSGIVVHGPLQRRQTPYPRFVVTTGNQAARRPPLTNEESLRNRGAEIIEDRRSRAKAQGGPANEG